MGVYKKQSPRNHYSRNTGEVDFRELDLGAAKKVYYIPFSKKAVHGLGTTSIRSILSQV